jgi:hypothetical protein
MGVNRSFRVISRILNAFHRSGFECLVRIRKFFHTLVIGIF